jgi:hypothetical protein
MDMELNPTHLACCTPGLFGYIQKLRYSNGCFIKGASKMKSIQMKKLVVSTLAAAALFAAMSPAAQAVTTATGAFNVNITLTSVCTVDTSATSATFAYTSQQVAAATFASGFNVTCTNGLPITSVTLDSLAVTDAATSLAYTLALGAVPPTGTGAPQAITVSGNMVAGQVGTCAGASCSNAASANKTRTVTISY